MTHTHAQGTIYNAIAAARARDLGMELAAGKNNVVLEFAKEGARRIALSRESREVTADDVQLTAQTAIAVNEMVQVAWTRAGGAGDAGAVILRRGCSPQRHRGTEKTKK